MEKTTEEKLDLIHQLREYFDAPEHHKIHEMVRELCDISEHLLNPVIRDRFFTVRLSRVDLERLLVWETVYEKTFDSMTESDSALKELFEIGRMCFRSLERDEKQNDV